MDTLRISRLGLGLLAAGLLVGGALIGSAASALRDQSGGASVTPQPTVAVSATAGALPAADIGGDDLSRLPRYPASVRTGYEVIRDGSVLLTSVEYLAAAPLDEVRAFYQRVIVEHGWERADIGLTNGEWTYVLIDGSTEALIELEEIGSLVEIDLQIIEPVARPTAAPTPAPVAPPTPAPAAPPQQPVAPPPQAPGDDDDDGEDDDGGDDASDDG